MSQQNTAPATVPLTPQDRAQVLSLIRGFATLTEGVEKKAQHDMAVAEKVRSLLPAAADALIKYAGVHESLRDAAMTKLSDHATALELLASALANRLDADNDSEGHLGRPGEKVAGHRGVLTSSSPFDHTNSRDDVRESDLLLFARYGIPIDGNN